ncbi:MAG: type III-A CRISPR-associated RAMP protein Csm3 [Bacteroidales bacterium]|jgi:CRISPR-associated protein Csm3|nr:type III-A CRISPR-associated RAMP protein Csm3 [Bacteroidales bacterium]
MKTKLIKKLNINYKMHLVTGLHIGDSKENVEIGGIDNPIVRKSIDNVPYIPGSSIKGKIRSLLEQISGATEIGNDEAINDLFGFAKKDKSSRLIVRDAYMTEVDQTALSNSEFTDMPYSEVKFENTINRITGKADNPRQTERIPAGVSFDVSFVINVWDTDEDGEQSKALLFKGIEALENDYLGGSGSRGYGQVKFSEPQVEEVAFNAYFK